MKIRLARFLRDEQGVASLELVLLLPVFLLILLALLEVYLFFRTVAIIDRTAFELGNLVAEKAVLIDSNAGTDANQIGIFWVIAPQLAQPLDIESKGSVIITDVKDAGNGKPVIAWQRSVSGWGTGDASQLSGSSPLPQGFPFYEGDNTIVVEVFYHFSPFQAAKTFWPDAPGSVTLYRRVYFRPRFQNLDTLQAA
jgi:Flp pilus assembly protein TadG